ncbi:helix-turn-helix domain-containing protein [uncultured Vibrio sp.]|uniref:helix-turn-helix domain-containing protein n=1 Tax=uncultured Vibrio sp. TaxID=114054 RepID=UPI0025ED8F68|nr:AraC family transcriptional regulator [uncultured Vibrio sp.]
MNSRTSTSFRKSALVRWVAGDKKHKMVSEQLAETDPLLEGKIDTCKVKESFSLHWGATTELQDHKVISTARKALILIFLTKGKIAFSYDDSNFAMDAKHGYQGLAVNLAKPATFRRTVQKGNQVSKLKVIIPQDWLQERIESGSRVDDFISQHLANVDLLLNDHLHELIDRIILLHNGNDSFKKIKLEALTQNLVLEVFEQVSNSDRAAGSMALESQPITTDSAKSSIDGIINYIEDNLDTDLSVKALAEYAITSESNLRRKFKEVVGCSIKGYIRRRRLEVARKHLEQGLASITEVAYYTGYRHPSNFTSAYKKAFGYPPAFSVNKRD